MSGNYQVTLTDDSGDADVNRSFEMSKDELDAHFPKEVKMLQNSPCSVVSLKDEHGTVIIEKPSS